MKYKVRQKILSFKDDYTITDENGNDRFKVVGSFFTIRDKLQVVDLQTGRVVLIRQKLFKIFAEYHFEVDGKVEAVFKKKFKMLGTKFKINTANGDEYETKGGIFNYNFSIKRGREDVAVISKKLLALTDAYYVDIKAPDEDHALVMAVCIALDQVVHDEDDGKERSFGMLKNLLDN